MASEPPAELRTLKIERMEIAVLAKLRKIVNKHFDCIVADYMDSTNAQARVRACKPLASDR
jgi:hypothetical protein